MKDILLFIIGLLMGAILTAFLTPKSGTELRGDLAERYELSIQDLNQKVEQLQAQLKKSQTQESAQTGEATPSS